MNNEIYLYVHYCGRPFRVSLQFLCEDSSVMCALCFSANELMPGGKTNLLDSNLIYKVTQRYNDSLKFDPSEPKMAFTTRDPVRNGIDQRSCIFFPQ